jgi:hypothetical protein
LAKRFAVAAAGLVLAAAMAVTAMAASKAKPPALQALGVVRQVHYETPPGVTIYSESQEGTNGGAELTPDQKHLFFLATIEGGTQVVITNLSGKHLRCLTCGVSKGAAKPNPLEDGKRLWFSDNAGGNLGEQQWAILECAPSIYNCQTKRKLDVEFPIDSIFGNPGAQNREAKPDPYGEFVAWNEVNTEDGTKVAVAKLTREATQYKLVEPRIVSPQFSTDSSNPQDWIDGGRFYEGGNWTAGNRFLKYQTTTTGLNYDTTLVNLRTGQRRFITDDLDYNELGDYSPNGKWTLYSSARGLDRMLVFTELQRPTFLDFVAFGQMGRISLWNNRRCMNEMWLMDARVGQRRGGYAGQPVVLHDDWNIRTVDWFAAGNKAIVNETRLPNDPYPTEPSQRAKTLIVRMPGIAARKPPKLLHVSWKAIESYTVPESEYHGMASRQVSDKTIQGPGGGTATFNFSGSFASGAWSVSYDNYSSDGNTFLSGTESLVTPLSSVEATWKADLAEHGEHNGTLRGDLTINGGKTFTGTIESDVDGVHRDGVPTQETCPGLRKPHLRARVVRRRLLPSGRRVAFVKVDTQVAGDALQRPVQAARVELGGAHARTDARGVARLVVGGKPRSVSVRVKAGSFLPVQRRVSLP